MLYNDNQESQGVLTIVEDPLDDTQILPIG